MHTRHCREKNSADSSTTMINDRRAYRMHFGLLHICFSCAIYCVLLRVFSVHCCLIIGAHFYIRAAKFEVSTCESFQSHILLWSSCQSDSLLCFVFSVHVISLSGSFFFIYQ